MRYTRKKGKREEDTETLNAAARAKVSLLAVCLLSHTKARHWKGFWSAVSLAASLVLGSGRGRTTIMANTRVYTRSCTP